MKLSKRDSESFLQIHGTASVKLCSTSRTRIWVAEGTRIQGGHVWDKYWKLVQVQEFFHRIPTAAPYLQTEILFFFFCVICQESVSWGILKKFCENFPIHVALLFQVKNQLNPSTRVSSCVYSYLNNFEIIWVLHWQHIYSAFCAIVVSLTNGKLPNVLL